MRAVLRHVKLPEFGSPTEQPLIPASLYRERLAAFTDRFRIAGYNAVLVYADREHSANLSYLTGFDPRFEEALLILSAGRDPVMLTGPENRGLAASAAIPMDVTLYPPLGLPGQDRSKTPPLSEILAAHGIARGMTVGMTGWKYFGAAEAAEPATWLEVPSYLADAVRLLTGPTGRVVNANALLMHPSSGLRAINEIDQLAAFEFASCHTSDAVRRVVVGARPGMREFDAARLLEPIGLPLSCHQMVSSGARAAFGLCSPSSKRIEAGDPITIGYGVWGALNCRAGWMVAEAGELPEGVRDYIQRLAAPYFATVAQWYQTIGIGVPGGVLYDIVQRRLGDPFFGVFLNPGHLIHQDEWMNTPIYARSTEHLVSGQALQADIIPATGSAYFTSNVEDGIALLDEHGRSAFAERYPAAWDRINHRRAFMASALGIELKPEVLPFSNMPAYLTPFFQSPEQALVIAA